MNKVILMGRLTRDPEVRYSAGDSSMAIARYSLAIDRRRRQNAGPDEPTTDFFNCVAFGRSGEFAEKYFRKGMRVLVTGRLQNGSYTNKDGIKVNTTDIIVEEQEFADGKNENAGGGNFGGSAFGGQTSQPTGAADGFMPIPDGIDEELPFA